jgi:hypothetical protein
MPPVGFSGHYPSSYLLFKTLLNSIGLSVPHRKHITSPLRAQQVNAMYRVWQWYINITLKIPYIVHRPIFYLKLNSIISVCSYLAGNTLRLCYEPNRLMLSIGLWRWYVNNTIAVLDLSHHPVFHLKSLEASVGIVPLLGPQPLSCISFPVHQLSYNWTLCSPRYWEFSEMNSHTFISYETDCIENDASNSLFVLCIQSQSLYGWQSVSQYVLVSSPLCGRLTSYCFLFKCLGLKRVVLSVGRPLWREAGSVLCKSQFRYLSVCTLLWELL